MKNILIFAGIAVAGYAGYMWWKSSQTVTGSSLLPDEPKKLPDPLTSGGSIKPLPIATTFPLKYGSQGEEVKALQSAIIKKIGIMAASTITNTGGIDGKWGPGTEAARIKAGFPASISEDQFNYLVKNGGTVKLFGLKGLLAG